MGNRETSILVGGAFQQLSPPASVAHLLWVSSRNFEMWKVIRWLWKIFIKSTWGIFFIKNGNSSKYQWMEYMWSAYISWEGMHKNCHRILSWLVEFLDEGWSSKRAIEGGALESVEYSSTGEPAVGATQPGNRWRTSCWTSRSVHMHVLGFTARVSFRREITLAGKNLESSLTSFAIFFSFFFLPLHFTRWSSPDWCALFGSFLYPNLSWYMSMKSERKLEDPHPSYRDTPHSFHYPWRIQEEREMLLEIAKTTSNFSQLTW